MSFVFLPKVLGVLIQVAGLCYTTNGFALFLAPTVADRMFPAIPAPNGGSLASRARSVLASVR